MATPPAGKRNLLKPARPLMQAHPMHAHPVIAPPTRLVVSGGAKAEPITILSTKPGLLARILKGSR